MGIRSIIASVVFRLRGNVSTEKLVKRGLFVGDNFYRGHDVLIDDSHCWLIEIGNNVTLAPRVHILAHDASTKILIGYTRIGNVKIGNNVFIGAGSIVLPGVTIGNNCIVGAGSVVTHDLECDAVYAGNPCVKITTIQQFKEKHEQQLQRAEIFDETYTLKNINRERKEEMTTALKEKHGYVK